MRFCDAARRPVDQPVAFQQLDRRSVRSRHDRTRGACHDPERPVGVASSLRHSSMRLRQRSKRRWRRAYFRLGAHHGFFVVDIRARADAVGDDSA